MTYLEKALDYYTSGEYLESEYCTPFLKDIARVCIEQDKRGDLPIDVTESNVDTFNNHMIGLLWVLHELNFQSVTDELLNDVLVVTGPLDYLTAPAMYGRAYVRKYTKDDGSTMLDRMKRLTLSDINKDVRCFFNALYTTFPNIFSDGNDPYTRLMLAINDLNLEFFSLTSDIDDDLYDDDDIFSYIIDGMDKIDRSNKYKLIALYTNIYKIAAIADIDSFTHLTAELKPLPKFMLYELYLVLVRATELEYPDNDEGICNLMLGNPWSLTDEDIRNINATVKNLAAQRLNSKDDIYSSIIITKYLEKWSN